MTKKLEELFELAQVDDSEPRPILVDPNELLTAQQELDDANTLIDKIDQALPQVRDLDNADNELDELADLAKEKFQDMMDLGMNVEARFSGQILQTAGVLLGHAITAKQAKIDKKLRMIDLQLKKMRLDHANNRDRDNEQPIDGQAVVVDRNELLRQILNKQNPK